MFELFKAELLRFRQWALALAGVHFIALGFLTRVVDLAQQPLVVHWSFGGTYAALGLLLGLYQMGTYRKPSAWLNMLHRPLSPPRIAISLIAAGVALLAVAVALPIALIALWQGAMTPRVVDVRHWLLALAALQIATAGYLVGAYGMLGERRYCFSGLVFPMLLLTAVATGSGALAVQALAVLWLIAMVLATFKPDLDAPPRSAAGMVAVALPLQMAMYLSMLLAYSGIEMLWIAQGSHPNNSPTPPRGGHNEAEKVDDRTRMRLALEGSSHPDAPLLREQIALSEPTGIASQVRRLPQYSELANVAPMEFDDDARGVRWVFSHDDMRLHGYRLIGSHAGGHVGRRRRERRISGTRAACRRDAGIRERRCAADRRQHRLSLRQRIRTGAAADPSAGRRGAGRRRSGRRNPGRHQRSRAVFFRWPRGSRASAGDDAAAAGADTG